MQKKETKKNNSKTGYSGSSKTKGLISEESRSVAVAEQPKAAKPASSTKLEALRSSEKSLQPSSAGDIPRDRIEERAKAIWEQRGRPQGDDQSNWYEAENQLRHELAGQR